MDLKTQHGMGNTRSNHIERRRVVHSKKHVTSSKILGHGVRINELMLELLVENTERCKSENAGTRLIGFQSLNISLLVFRLK